MSSSTRSSSAPSHRAPLVFLNASLSGLGDRLLNDAVISELRKFDVDVYAPQIELPLDTKLSPREILMANSNAIRRCDFVLSILDKPGHGVAYELGLATALEKPILGFRSSSGEYLGKILEGLWESLRPEARAISLEDLPEMLGRHFRRYERLANIRASAASGA